VSELRRWFARHHRTADELVVGFHKAHLKLPTPTYAQALDEALCVGWIDGLKRRVDERSYSIRFTPRRPTSYWSATNIRHAARLTAEGRMLPAGEAALARRGGSAERRYSFEQRHAAELDAECLRVFRRHRAAWRFFSAQAPSYRRTAAWWVMSAKRSETKRRRLDALVAASAAGSKPGPFLVSRASRRKAR
jgi:uncharacterized protein YdeI (YjbR/CyaY-like superfamily)